MGKFFGEKIIGEQQQNAKRRAADDPGGDKGKEGRQIAGGIFRVNRAGNQHPADQVHLVGLPRVCLGVISGVYAIRGQADGIVNTHRKQEQRADHYDDP